MKPIKWPLPLHHSLFVLRSIPLVLLMLALHHLPEWQSSPDHCFPRSTPMTSDPRVYGSIKCLTGSVLQLTCFQSGFWQFLRIELNNWYCTFECIKCTRCWLDRNHSQFFHAAAGLFFLSFCSKTKESNWKDSPFIHSTLTSNVDLHRYTAICVICIILRQRPSISMPMLTQWSRIKCFCVAKTKLSFRLAW